MTEIYLHIVARMADYMDTHPYCTLLLLDVRLLRDVGMQAQYPKTQLSFQYTSLPSQEAPSFTFDLGAQLLPHLCG